MSVSLESGVYHCFGCKRRGNFAMLYMELEGVSWKVASERCMGVFYEDWKPREEVVITLPPNLISCKLKLSPYLKSRGFEVEDLKPFDVYWRMTDHVVFFPVYDENQKLVSYASRKSVGKSAYFYPRSSPHMNYLYGEHLKLEERVFIVEGMLDAVSVYRSGYSVLATFNTNFTLTQLNRLLRFAKDGCKKYVVMYDFDASDKGDDLEFELSSMGVEVSQLKLSYGDPGDKTKEQMIEIISNFLDKF